MAEAQKIQIKCPSCGMPYQAAVQSIIDVGKNPELRRALLSGQLNVAVCPNCKTPVALEVPLVYHDASADFLGIYLPQQVNLPEMERQKMIGELTQQLMRGLPPEQRKGYFLNPRQFINRQSFMDAIMGTMGVSQEELDRQRMKMKLLDQALVMVDDPKGLQLLVKQNDAQMDYEFFAILNSLSEQAMAAGGPQAEKLEALHDKLETLSTFGKKMAKQEAAVQSLGEIKSPEQLVDRIVAADPDEVDAIVVAARPLLDYAFFQTLSERVGAAQGAEKDRLTKLRERLLTITQQIDEATRATFGEATELLRQIMTDPNPRSAVHAHIEEIDDAFMAVLQMNLQEASKQGAREVADLLGAIYDEIMIMVEESMPPEVQLINELLRAPYPDGTRGLLKQHQAELTPEVLQLMDRVAEELKEREDEESAKRLRDIKTQAMLLV
jgi:hypothetical protein